MRSKPIGCESQSSSAATAWTAKTQTIAHWSKYITELAAGRHIRIHHFQFGTDDWVVGATQTTHTIFLKKKLFDIFGVYGNLRCENVERINYTTVWPKPMQQPCRWSYWLVCCSACRKILKFRLKLKTKENNMRRRRVAWHKWEKWHEHNESQPRW